MAGLAKYLPNSANLKTKDGEVPYTSLAGKTVFFYFSASWCPSCRGFTPQLIEFYEKFAKEKNFEVVLIPWDEDEEDYKTYFAKLPWLSLPFADRKGVELLVKEFDVQFIPTLIGVDADTGKVITTKARAMIPKDPEGKEYPWGQ